MYILEKLIKFFKTKKIKTKYRPSEIETCEHFFLPIDSSGEYLACTKCGKLIKAKDYKWEKTISQEVNTNVLFFDFSKTDKSYQHRI